ncbi:MAG: exodeoxyribonuclease VII small subunit [Bacteroidetes bacterium]|nr:exodeoxyribonuclease VII small subunit [Bacteroidota bacterium]
MKEPKTYEAAFAELQEILNQVQNPETGVDELEKKMDRARQLIAWCRDRLRGLEEKLEG